MAPATYNPRERSSIARLALHALLCGVCLGLASCGAVPTVGPRSGPWRFDFRLSAEGSMPVNATFERHGDAYEMTVQNATELIRVTDIHLNGDSLHIRMPLYDSGFAAKLVGDSLLHGVWYNKQRGGDYSVPFRAQAGKQDRFTLSSRNYADVSGRWEAHFGSKEADAFAAVGLFQQDGARVTGTFATETGDFRFLEGGLRGDSLFLSAFDGSHAILLTAILRNDSLLGSFRSGTHWQQDWTGVRNSAFALRDADSITAMDIGDKPVSFSFPTIDNKRVSLSDEVYRSKVVLLQIMGSWCPNCADESVLLKEMYARYHDQGLEVLSLAFERHKDPANAMRHLRRFRDELALPWEIAYVGQAKADTVRAKLPLIKQLVGYPTCVFIDRAGSVRRVHTGFYGPGTGELHATFREDLGHYLEALLTEPIALVRSRPQ
jgi:peroxiredoxin